MSTIELPMGLQDGFEAVSQTTGVEGIIEQRLAWYNSLTEEEKYAAVTAYGLINYRVRQPTPRELELADTLRYFKELEASYTTVPAS